jgi:nicotinamide-nucleotide amidase
LAHDARADVKIMAKSESAAHAEAAIAPLQREIEHRLAGFVYGIDGTTPEGAVHALLRTRGWTVATAESCTGGRIAAALTSEAGSSATFAGGVVAYGNDVKTGTLGLDLALIEHEGAVSEAVALAMARGARARLRTSLAISTTGVAGPSGGTPEKPVGLVWFAIDDADGRSRAVHVHFRGDRAAIQARATTYALGMLWRHLSRDSLSS